MVNTEDEIEAKENKIRLNKQARRSSFEKWVSGVQTFRSEGSVASKSENKNGPKQRRYDVAFLCEDCGLVWFGIRFSSAEYPSFIDRYDRCQRCGTDADGIIAVERPIRWISPLKEIAE